MTAPVLGPIFVTVGVIACALLMAAGMLADWKRADRESGRR